METVLVVAVHPDDETLGCGGAILRHRARHDEVHWLIVTSISQDLGFTASEVEARAAVINRVSEAYGFSEVHDLGLSTTKLDTLPKRTLVEIFSGVFNQIRPQTVYLPYLNDAHSDHRWAFEAAFSCTKSFRHPEVRRVLMMETISETEFAPALPGCGFTPNVFVDISEHMAKKLEILKLYESEIAPPPFPRSLANVEALAVYRGSTSGFRAAEAFMLLLERIS
ncbi:MAG: PIG-L family deacetylase [Deltaproteobacteria bacterium]|nr:PIG-L family deacetylase [Deltaproteobacteria bacterium]